MSQYKLNLPIDVFKMSLKISLGSLDKIFIVFKALRVNRRFATAQIVNFGEEKGGKVVIAVGYAQSGDLQVCVSEGDIDSQLVPSQ